MEYPEALRFEARIEARNFNGKMDGMHSQSDNTNKISKPTYLRPVEHRKPLS